MLMLRGLLVTVTQHHRAKVNARGPLNMDPVFATARMTYC